MTGRLLLAAFFVALLGLTTFALLDQRDAAHGCALLAMVLTGLIHIESRHTAERNKAFDRWFTQHGDDIGWFVLRRNTPGVDRATLRRLAYGEWCQRVGAHPMLPAALADRFDDGGTAEYGPGQMPGCIL